MLRCGRGPGVEDHPEARLAEAIRSWAFGASDSGTTSIGSGAAAKRRLSSFSIELPVRLPAIVLVPKMSSVVRTSSGSGPHRRHQAQVLRRPELAVHGKSERFAVEPPAALGFRRVQEDPAAQHVHGDHPPLP